VRGMGVQKLVRGMGVQKLVRGMEPKSAFLPPFTCRRQASLLKTEADLFIRRD